MQTARVLVVDDSPTMRQLIVFALRRIPGLQIDEAGDGIAALKLMSSERYDMLLTDINMPLMDGLKLISLLRNDQQYSDLPIVVITTEGAALDRERATVLGATEYLCKPIQTAQVVDVTKRLLQKES
ncbi:two-component system, chemotaxis family, response regulator CheY [Malonomonas rubra DSM 5091]|uniref:Two-component system, chemotaxis family, response regulator CheY n=1 Tax=Malonomonas rubra DSM 5091 TaxID=1122189 RepID=A0A1M6DF87_MALRU|nr:response regulator [Malonomonas rubra]SHI71850.1 two-component system, chemotaxis family, response regulator CheY [Malonomonas rubra DSM 5091]